MPEEATATHEVKFREYSAELKLGFKHLSTPGKSIHGPLPRGIPVATVAIGNAANAGLLAVRILGAANPGPEMDKSLQIPGPPRRFFGRYHTRAPQKKGDRNPPKAPKKELPKDSLAQARGRRWPGIWPLGSSAGPSVLSARLVE